MNESFRTEFPTHFPDLHGTLIKRGRQLLVVIQGGFFPNPGWCRLKGNRDYNQKRIVSTLAVFQKFMVLSVLGFLYSIKQYRGN